jgi:uncharacterized protein YjiK
MFKKYKSYIFHTCLSICILPAIFFFACSRNDNYYKSPPNYDLNRPSLTIKLPSELDDISGITYYSKDNALFAESDQKGCLYKIFLNKPTDIRKWKFSHKRDYEDIALYDSTFYIINNNGDIVSLNFIKDSIITHDYMFPEKGKYEFESLYYDDQLKKLVLMCKECEIDKDTTVSTYTFDPQQFTYAGAYTIGAQKVLDANSPKSTKFKPSGASVNPVTGDLYILSSINKTLVVAERQGAVKQVYRLDPSLFNKPEGIAFSSTGGLFISNEAAAMQPATVLFYQFKNTDR